MLLADDVFNRALVVRDCRIKFRDEFEKLESAVSVWTNATYGSDDKTRIDALDAVLKNSEKMRTDLAEAVNWDEPMESSAELVLLAVTAIHEGADQEFAKVFGSNLDWQKWKSTHDLGVLQSLLEFNSEVRNELAKAVKGYPGIRHVRELAGKVIQLLPAVATGDVPSGEEARFDVLKEHLLNRKTFAVGMPGQEPASEVVNQNQNAKAEWEQKRRQAEFQESHFKAILETDYAFRQAVAKAVGQPNSEAVELAGLAVEMWRSIPPSSLISRDRAGIIMDKKLNDKIPVELLARKDDPSDEGEWGKVRDSLAVSFADNPQKAIDLWDAMGWPYPFALVLREELRQIQARWSIFSALGGSGLAGQGMQLAGASPIPPGGGSRPPNHHWTPSKRPPVQNAVQASDASDLAVQMNLFGVAFSGGGIRSATFNLGVLQQLSHFGLLGEADYLSTVSGGGYIGSWLTGWMRKSDTTDPAKFHNETESLLSPKIPDPRADVQRPVRFLREFSNYLTPKLGSFSFDTWTMAAVYSRNLILNQATLICVLGFLLLLPRFMTFARTWQIQDWWMWALALVLVGTGVYFMTVNIRCAVDPDGKALNKFIARLMSNRFVRWINEFTRDHVQLTVVGAILAGMYFGSLWMWRNIDPIYSHLRRVYIWTAIVATILSLLLSVLGGFYEEFCKRQVGKNWWLPVLAMITVLSAGATTGLVRADLAAMNALKNLGEEGTWHLVILSPLMLLATMVIPGTLQVGLMGVDFPDAGREWLSRFRAICAVYSVWWIAFLGAAIYGPWLVWSIRRWASGLTAGWIVTTIGGLLAGKSNKTGDVNEGAPKFSWLQLLARIGPPVFAAGLVLLIATVEQVLLAHGAHKDLSAYWMTLDRHHLFDLSGWFVDQPGWLLLVLLAAGVILAWRVDINEFSMHHFYKNRLVRCYLGASDEHRRPNEFTGFDARDDLRLALLKTIPKEEKKTDENKRQARSAKDEEEKEQDTPYLGPYPILNTTLNLSTGEQLAWQERKGTSFILTPCFCGFDVQGWASTTAVKKKTPSTLHRSEELLPAGYRKTSGFTHEDGPFLGTAFSISGAAANPNQGYNTSPAVAFLMTMFDVRLGWWLGNPRRKTTWMRSSPTFGLGALLSELMGMTNDTAAFVNLSDGGHFDNMGLYELVRRRCSLILLCDAEQDAEFKFEGLGSAIRKCRIDFGAYIEIDTSLIRPGKDGQPSSAHCAVGTIVYLDGSRGKLVYIKPSLTGDEPEDVTQYHQAHPDFPHETTADQWFTESQFESYRALGYHAAGQTLKPAGAWIDWNPEQPDVPKLIKALSNYWYPENPNLKDNASRHTATLVQMLNSIRETRELRELGSKLFPGITVPPPDDASATQEFYFGLSILQLVEDIYFDFKLDRPVWADDPRIGGWNNLFRTWKNVPEVAAAWASERDTFRKDFQIFWDKL